MGLIRSLIFPINANNNAFPLRAFNLEDLFYAGYLVP
jgi:hypothetical protein